MGFYDLTKEEREKLVIKIQQSIFRDLKENKLSHWIKFFSDKDTYIRKSAYLAVGKLFKAESHWRELIINNLQTLYKNPEFKIRQTTINAAGEIGIVYFNFVESFFDTGLFDKHHSVRNAVVGSMKKMGQKNPHPVIQFAYKYLHHTEAEIRREICHGIELRGRTHPEDILPLLKELQFDTKPRVRNTLVHVLGQIAYKKGCLEKVIDELNNWENKKLVEDALEEILDVHIRYKNFSAISHDEAKKYIDENYIS